MRWKTYLSSEMGREVRGPEHRASVGGEEGNIVRGPSPSSGPRQKAQHRTQRCRYHGKAHEWRCPVICQACDNTGTFRRNRWLKRTHRCACSHCPTSLLRSPLHHLHLTLVAEDIEKRERRAIVRYRAGVTAGRDWPAKWTREGRL